MIRRFFIAVGAVLLAATPACGGSDAVRSADRPGGIRTVEITMVDIAFTPDRISVVPGEEVRFVFTNSGRLPHEAYVGTRDDQADHAAEMEGGSAGDHGDHGGGDTNGAKIEVDPGERGELKHRFEEAGTYEIGCHEPGHYAAGMKVIVEAVELG